MPRARQLITGSCSHCQGLFKVNTINGTIHKHGQRSNPCPGSSHPPHNGTINSTDISQGDVTTSPPCSSNSDTGQFASSSETSHSNVSSAFSSLLAHPVQAGSLVKRIPRSARQGCSSLLSNLIQGIVDDITNIKRWDQFFRFGAIILAKPKRGGKKRNLSNLIIKRLSKFPESIDEHDDTNSRCLSKRANVKIDSEKYLANMVASKIEEGNFKAAVRILCSDDRLASESLSTLESLQKKHPPVTLDKDALRKPEELTVTPLQVSISDVRDALSSFPSGSAGGPDSITPQHLKDLTASGIDGDLLTSITALTNLMLAGKIPENMAPILFGGSLIALEKKTGGIRPIAVGYVWRRIAAKCANHFALESVTSYLSPLQLGVGVAGGAEAAVHSTRRYLQSLTPGKVIVKLDFANAFNSLMRFFMLEAVATHAPEIYSLCYSAYASPTVLRYGAYSILSAEGPQQGDPLGSLLFSITIHPLLQKLAGELVIAYLDDITIGGTVDVVAADIIRVKEEASELGLQLNESKCELIIPDESNFPQEDVFKHYQRVSPNEAFLLGAPLLPGTAINAALNSRHNDLKQALQRLQLIDIHDALLILKNSLHVPKLLYTLRTSACHGNPILDEIDNSVKEALSNILNLSISDEQWTQASLPVKNGGLGIRSVASLASSAFLASAASTCELQENILIRTSAMEDTVYVSTLESWLASTGVVPPEGPAAFRQKNWDAIGIELTKTALLSNSTSDNDRARILASQAKHSGDWLNALPISACGLRMSNDVIRISVGFRLGVRLCQPHTCQCGKIVDAFGTHSLSCHRSAGRQLRHHLINDIIWRSMSRAKIYARKEPANLFRTDSRRPDGVTLSPWQAGKFLMWDATVADTHAASHIAKTSLRAGAAADEAAELKCAKYRGLDSSHIFVPVAIETLGPINETGSNFLTELGRRMEQATSDKLEIAHLFQQISIAVQRGNAASFNGCFENFHTSWD